MRRGRGKGEKGKGWRRKGGKVIEGMGGTGQEMGWGGEGRERKGMEMEDRGYSSLNFNSWRRHVILTEFFVY